MAVGTTLQLLVHGVDDRDAQVRWLDGSGGDWSYKVRRKQLLGNAAELRVRLQSCLRAHRTAPGGTAARSALVALIQAGRVLYESLFGDDPVAAQARELYEELDKDGPLHLQVKVDPTLALPWTLVVPTQVGPTEEKADDPAALGRVFWCLRHDLSVSMFGVRGMRGPVGAGEYRALALLNQRIYDDVRRSLTDPAELHWVQARLDAQADGTSFSSTRFEKAVRAAADEPGVRLRFAYLLGHASGEHFEFAEDDKLSASTLATDLRYRRSGSQRQETILFLNGCETASEGGRFSFAEMVGDFGVAALLGTEVKVPDRFGFRYALAFLQLVLGEGWTLRRALDKLRREHLPLSLAYSLYAADGPMLPAGTVDPQFSATRESGADGNYSNGPVRC